MKVWLSHLFIRLLIVIISNWTNYFIQGHNFWKYEKLENCYLGRRLCRERDFQRLKRNWSLFGFDQNSIFLLDHSGLLKHSFNLKIWTKGKTSLCVRYAHNTFEPSHLSTIQAALITKKLKVRSGEKVMVDFCDTAGQKRFHSLGSIYYKKADAAIVVYDRTDSKSLQEGFLIHNSDFRYIFPMIRWTAVFNCGCQRSLHGLCWNQIQRAKDWILELRKSLPLSFPIILVGNKSDLKQKVNFQSHESITSYHETSAKLNTGIRNVISR